MPEGFLAGTGWDDPCYDNFHFFVDPVPKPGTRCQCGATYYRIDGYAIMDALYNRQAADIERMLRENFPKLRWWVTRAEDVCGSPEEFLTSHSWKFEIWCGIPALEWRARHFLSREAWDYEGTRLAPMIGAAFAGHIAAYLFGGTGDG